MGEDKKDGGLVVNAATLNAIVEAMGALTMCISRQLPPDKQVAFSMDLARLAAQAESEGDTLLETLLIDLHRAA